MFASFHAKGTMLCIMLLDYVKAFDSAHTEAIITPLQEQGIEDVDIENLEDIDFLYINTSVSAHLHKVK